jgi:uncharacterized protein
MLAVYATTVSAVAPSAESVDTLLTVSRTESIMDTLYAQMEQGMRQGMAHSTAGKRLSEEQERFLDDAPKQFMLVMKDEFSWAKLKPAYISIYQEVFSQEEIDGLIAVYRSPLGATIIEKMPLVIQKSSQATQARLPAMLEKMKVMIDKSLADAKVVK